MSNDVRPVSYSKVYRHEFLRSMLDAMRLDPVSLVDLALLLTRKTLTLEENNTLTYSVVTPAGNDEYIVYLSNEAITQEQIDVNLKALDNILDDQRQVKLLQAQYNVNFNAARAMRRDKLKIQELQLELKQLKDTYAIQEPKVRGSGSNGAISTYPTWNSNSPS